MEDEEFEASLANGGDQGQPGGEAQERPLTAREMAMNAIQVVREDGETSGSALPAATPPAAGGDGAADPQDPQQENLSQLALQAAGPQTLSQDLDKVMVKVKIHGVEREVSVADMQRQYQINGAAEVRLQQATQLLNQAKAKVAAAPPVGGDAGQPGGDSSAAPGNKLSAKEIVQALFEGDEDKATQLVEQMLERRPHDVAPTQDPAQLVEQLAPVLKQQFEFESALDKFMAANADIVQDPHLVDLTGRFLDAEVAGGKPYPEALVEAGKQTRDWLAKMGVKQATEPNPTTSRDKKLERKAAMDNLPALNKTASSVQESPQTASSVIQEMRKSRGLA